MTLNKKHCLIFLTVFVILLIGATTVSATTDTNKTQEVLDNNKLSTPAKYDVDKMVQSEASQASKDADEYNKNTSKQESKQITKKTDTTTKEAQEITVNDYAELKTYLTSETYDELELTLNVGTYTSNGAITVNSAIKNLTINGNGQTINGGGVAFLTLNNMNSTIKNLTISGAKGAVKATNTNLTIMDSTFNGNNGVDGSALYISGGETTVVNSTFIQNSLPSASTSYGVVKVTGGILTLDNNTFDRNSMYGTQGFIIYTTQSSKIVNNKFINNSCHDTGNDFSGLINILVNEIHDNEYLDNLLSVRVNFGDYPMNAISQADVYDDIELKVYIPIARNVVNSTVNNGYVQVEYRETGTILNFDVIDGIAYTRLTYADIQANVPDYTDESHVDFTYYSSDKSFSSGISENIRFLPGTVRNPTLTATVNPPSAPVGEKFTIKGTLKNDNDPMAANYVNLSIDGEYVATGSTNGDGEVYFNITPTAVGTYTATLTVGAHGGIRNAKTATVSFRALGTPSEISLYTNTSAVTAREHVKVNGTLINNLTKEPISGATVNLTFNNAYVSSAQTDPEGYYEFDYIANVANDANDNLKVFYGGDVENNIESCSNSTKLTVNPLLTNITLESYDTYYGGRTNISGSVYVIDTGEIVQSGQVKIQISGVSGISTVNIVEGKFVLNNTITSMGAKTATVTYVASGPYGASVNTTQFTVNKMPTNMTINTNGPIKVGTTLTVSGNLSNIDGNYLGSRQYVDVTVGTQTKHVRTSNTGAYTASFTLTEAGDYDINLSYIGNTSFEASKNSTVFKLYKIPTITNVTVVNNTVYNVAFDVVVRENDTKFNSIIQTGNLNVTLNDEFNKIYPITGDTTRIVLDEDVNITTTDEVDLKIEFVETAVDLNSTGINNTTSEKITKFTARPLDSNLTIFVSPGTQNMSKDVTISGQVIDEMGNIVEEGTVTLDIMYVDDPITVPFTGGRYEYVFTTNHAGDIDFNVTFNPKLTEKGNILISQSKNSSKFEVVKVPTFTTVSIINNTAGNVTLNVSVSGEDGNKTMIGNVTITIDGNKIVRRELSGSENTIINLGENLAHSGLDSITLEFDGNDNYLPSEAYLADELFTEMEVVNQTPILKVEMLEANVVNSTTATIIGTLTDDLGHNISDAYIEVMVDGENVGVVRTNSTGGFTFEYTANKLGENIVNVTYLGDNIRYSNATNSTKFTVYKLNTTVELNVTDINYTNTEIINFTINETEATGLVTVEVTGDVEGFTPITEDYEFDGEVLRLPLSSLKAGTYTVTVSYPGDGKYNANSTIRTFKVESQPDYNINVSAVNITYGEEETITVSLPEDAKGTVNVKITGINNNFVTDKTIDLSSGNTLVIPAYELVVGEYEVNISYSDDNYALKTNTTKFTVSKAESHITVSVDDVVGTETAVANLTIKDTNADGKANITIYDSKNEQVGDVISVDRVTIEESVFADLIKLVPGIYTVNVTYYDDNNYNNSNASYTFTVNRIPTVTNVTIVNNTAGNVTLNITVKGADNKIIKEGKVNITVAGNIVDVDLSGDDYTVVNLADNITTSGEISVTVLYTGNDTYLESFANNTADNKQLEYINVDKQVPIITVNVDKANVVNTTSVLISGTLSDDFGNNIADKYVDIYVQGELVGSVKTDSNGKYTYTLVADTLGEIVVNATFPGDSGEAPRYSNATNNTKFTVYKLNTTIELNVTDINYTNTEIINFTINETEATGLVTVMVTGEGIPTLSQVYEFNGEVLQLPLSGLKAGTYTVTVSYPGDGKYNGNSTEKTFTVNKNSDYKLNVTANNITYGEIDYIIVNLPEDAKGIVTINVTGFDPIELNLTKYNSIKSEAYELAAGEYTVNISYTDDNYALKTNTTTFTVGKAASNVGVSAVNITRGYNETITVTLPEYEHAKGNVSVIISKTDSIVREYVIEASQFSSTGFNMSIIENLDADTYHVNVFFTNDTNYNDSTYSQVFDVVLPEISLYDSSEILVGESVLIHGTVTDPNNKEITGSIRLKIKDESNNITYNEYEKGIDKVFIKEGIYTVTASYVYNGEIIVTSEPITIKVNKIPTKTTITIENSQVDNVSISVKVTDNQESPVTSGTLKVTLPTGNMSVPVKGTSTIIPVDTTKAGKIEVTVEYLENNEYKQSNATETITVTKLDTTIIVDATTPVKAGKTSIISGVLTDENNKALNAAKVQIKVDNRVVANVTTDKDGKYTCTVKDAIVGTHNVEAIYNGNNKYNGASDKTSFTVEKLGTKIIQDKIKDVPYGENITITGKLVDENNKAISGQPVKVRFDGKTKTVTTDKDGKYRAIFPTNSVGQKEASTEYAGNNKYDPTQVTDNAKVNKNKAKISLTMPKDAKVGQPTSIHGKVTDNDGKVVAGMPVNVKVNGKTIKTVTDDKGNFNVEVTPVEGNNPVTVTSGNENYDVDDVTSKFTATRKDATLSLDPLKNTKLKDNVTVTGKLVDEQNKPISYAPVQVTVNGKTSTVTTDKDGNYQLPATGIVEGTNNVSVKYEDPEYKTQTVKASFKASTSKTVVKVPSITGVIGEDITLTAYVTDDDGKPVSGGNLVFKLNGKTLRTDGRFDTNSSPLKLHVEDGVVKYTIKADLYLRNGKNITASYSGSSKYDAAKANVATANIKKRDAQVKVTITPNKAVQNNDIVFTATLSDVTPGATNKTSLTTDANIIFKVNGVTIKDKNGKADRIRVTHSVINYAYHVPTGMGGVDESGVKNYTVEAVYDNPVFYPDTRNSSVFHVQRSIINVNFIKTGIKNNVFSVKARFTDYENKNVVGNNKVCVKINGITYKENGEVKYFTVKDGNVDLTGIKIAKGTNVKEVMLVTGAREGYMGARATTTEITS